MTYISSTALCAGSGPVGPDDSVPHAPSTADDRRPTESTRGEHGSRFFDIGGVLSELTRIDSYQARSSRGSSGQGVPGLWGEPPGAGGPGRQRLQRSHPE